MERSLTMGLVAAVLISGCASGVRRLGEIQLKDGTTVEYVQVGSRGQDGPKLTVIEGYKHIPAQNSSEKVSAYQAAGSGIVADVLRGFGSAAAIAGGAVGAAAVLKPSKTEVNANAAGGTGVANPIQNASQVGASATANPSQTATQTANPTLTANPTITQTANPTQTNTQTGASATANPTVTATGGTSTATGGNATNTNTNQNCGGVTVNSSCR